MRKNQYYSSHHYQTGPTAPPKSHGGIIAILLIAVIFLCGLVSILSLMNIRLFQMVKTQQNPDISLQVRTSSIETEPVHTPRSAAYGGGRAYLGITGQEITPFYQQYYSIPKGIYIVDVDTGSDCYVQGLRDGDILLRFNGTRITRLDTLTSLLDYTAPGSYAKLCYYRDGAEHTVTVLIGREEGE